MSWEILPVSGLIEQVLSTYGVEIEIIYLGKPYARSSDTTTDISNSPSALMLTGATSRERLARTKYQPDYIFESL